MKIYTKTGDHGETGLFGGARVSKASARVEAYGTVDELNAAIGVARAAGLPPDVDAVLASVQASLFTLGAELATVSGKEASLGIALLGPEDVSALERAIDASEAVLEPLRNFVLPAGSPAASALHLARTVCRRAERAVVGLPTEDEAREEIVVYLNRLSDLLFSFARQANQRAGFADVAWTPRGA